MIDNNTPYTDLVPAGLPSADAHRALAQDIAAGILDESQANGTPYGPVPPQVLAQAKADRFKSENRQKLLGDDPAAWSQHDRLALKAAGLDPPPPTPDQFKSLHVGEMPEGMASDTREMVIDMVTKLELSPAGAQGFADLIMNDARRAGAMSPEEMETRSIQQENILRRSLGPEPEARMDRASAVLKNVLDRDVDLRFIARMDSELCLSLIHQAEMLSVKRAR